MAVERFHQSYWGVVFVLRLAFPELQKGYELPLLPPPQRTPCCIFPRKSLTYLFSCAVRQSQRKHIYAAHQIIHASVEELLADPALHQEMSASKIRGAPPAETASTAVGRTVDRQAAADRSHSAPVVAQEVCKPLHEESPQEPAVSPADGSDKDGTAT